MELTFTMPLIGEVRVEVEPEEVVELARLADTPNDDIVVIRKKDIVEQNVEIRAPGFRPVKTVKYVEGRDEQPEHVDRVAEMLFGGFPFPPPSFGTRQPHNVPPRPFTIKKDCDAVLTDY